MSWINSWTNSLVTSVIIVTILELILPEGKNKKYIKMVMGLYLLFTIIGPVITKFTNTSLDLKAVTEYENVIINSNKTVQALETTTEQNINVLYEKNITNAIKEELENKGYAVTYIKLDIDKNNYKTINSIKLNINTKDIKAVQEVKIGNSTNVDDSIKQEVKEILYLNYNISKDKIIINE